MKSTLEKFPIKQILWSLISNRVLGLVDAAFYTSYIHYAFVQYTGYQVSRIVGSMIGIKYCSIVVCMYPSIVDPPISGYNYGSAYPSILRINVPYPSILLISVPVDRTVQRTRRYYGSAYPSILRISVPVDTRRWYYYGSAYPSILRISVPVDITDQRTRWYYYGSAYPSILRISAPVDIADHRTRRYCGSAYPSILLQISVPVDITDQCTRRYCGSIRINVPVDIITDQRTRHQKRDQQAYPVLYLSVETITSQISVGSVCPYRYKKGVSA
jgi:hypothetical protein